MKNYKDFAVKLIKKAGKIAKDSFRKNHKITWKHNFGKSIVTETDIKINKLIKLEILKNFPEHNVISEEIKDTKNTSNYTWFIDPIDGTHAFTKGTPYFCIGIALVKNNNLLLSAAYDPIHKDFYVAEKNNGFYYNNQKIKSSASDKISDAMIDFMTWKNAPYDITKSFIPIFEKSWRVIRNKSLILAAGELAVGRIDALIFAGNHPWDIAPAALLTKEARLKTTDLFGNPPEKSNFTKGFISAKPKLHKRLLKLVKKYLK